MMGRVQECGCIALPEEVQKQAGLYPGASYEMELTADGAVVLWPVERAQLSEPRAGTCCG
jgi:antitoxin component of MazEF toxin-antitoxin module